MEALKPMHSGVNLDCAKRIWPRNQQAVENLAHCIMRACFWKERMSYVAALKSSDGLAKAINNSKDAKLSESLQWI